jgi:trehalose 6-phosphate phosphatase
MALSSARDERLPQPPLLELSRVALFADLDGTLAPLEATPDSVGPDAGRRRLLEALLRALSGRLAVVSGRALGDIDRVLEGRILAVGAVHGLVRRDAQGVVTTPPCDGRITGAREGFLSFARRDKRLLVEDKGPAVALHFRGAPQAGQACLDLAERLAPRYGLSVQKGDMVVELRRPGPDKGAAVEAFIGEPPFAGFTPVFLGDDLTDEAGFRAVRRHGGFGVIVGRRRPTAALYALDDVDAAQAWLRAGIEAAR